MMFLAKAHCLLFWSLPHCVYVTVLLRVNVFIVEHWTALIQFVLHRSAPVALVIPGHHASTCVQVNHAKLALFNEGYKVHTFLQHFLKMLGASNHSIGLFTKGCSLLTL